MGLYFHIMLKRERKNPFTSWQASRSEILPSLCTSPQLLSASDFDLLTQTPKRNTGTKKPPSRVSFWIVKLCWKSWGSRTLKSQQLSGKHITIVYRPFPKPESSHYNPSKAGSVNRSLLTILLLMAAEGWGGWWEWEWHFLSLSGLLALAWKKCFLILSEQALLKLRRSVSPAAGQDWE